MIDWHNYGWTILSGTKGPTHPFVAFSKAYECALGQSAPTANVTVTHAMRRELQRPPYDIKTPIVTLHDRPAAIFQPLASVSERLDILTSIPETDPYAARILAGETRLLVSSTSWTPDEDFALLLDALVSYAASDSDPNSGSGSGSGSDDENSNTRPAILAIITGKGPQKAEYLSRIRALSAAGQLPRVDIQTAWFPMEDYAALLRSADLGVCLHKSSSGVDLPMKVVDMFGSGLPVVAYSAYESFDELVREGVNGCGFETAPQLADLLRRLCSSEDELERLRRGAEAESGLRWDEEWDRVLGRVFGFTE